MATKQHSIRLVSIVVFALCVAANASPNDLAVRAKCQRSRINTMQRDGDDSPDLGWRASTTSPELQWMRATKLRASSPLASLDATVSSTGVLLGVPLSDQFHSPFFFLHAVLELSVPSGRGPPSL